MIWLIKSFMITMKPNRSFIVCSMFINRIVVFQFCIQKTITLFLLNQYSPVTRARSSTAGKDATSRRRARSASTDLCRLRNHRPKPEFFCTLNLTLNLTLTITLTLTLTNPNVTLTLT